MGTSNGIVAFYTADTGERRVRYVSHSKCCCDGADDGAVSQDLLIHLMPSSSNVFFFLFFSNRC